MTGTMEGARHQRAAELFARTWEHPVPPGVERPTGRYDLLDPSTGQVTTSAPDGTAATVDAVVGAASAAAPAWRDLPILERSTLLNRLAEAVADHAEDFAILDATSSGGPYVDMRRDVDTAVRGLRYFAGIGPTLLGETIPASSNLHFTERVPFGVVAKIVAFNHPFLFSLAKSAAPLMAGNTVVVKPPERAPLSALLLTQIAAEILPPGVFSLVVGDGPEVPQALVRHPAVRRISFVGSVRTGRMIQEDAARSGVKTVTLELGGKNALIAFDDTAPEVIADAAVRGMNYSWAGQSCGSTSRLLVPETIADEVCALVAAKVDALTLGHALDDATGQGPLISAEQVDLVDEMVTTARGEGARVVAGGHRAEPTSGGFFYAPTVIDHVTPEMEIARTEVFGPVLSILRWSDPDEAIALANSVDYGLTTAVFARDIQTALRTARRLDAGFVWVNGVSQHFTGVPYGGMKDSGIGRDNAVEELHSYTQTRATTVYL